MLPSELNQKYELRGTLGRGAMGVVYEAADRFLGRSVAIKVVKRQRGTDAEGMEADQRFRREAQAAGRFTHTNIVMVYDYGENADQAWIVMEKVEGGSLKERFDRRERFSMPEIVRIMDEILRGLGYAHTNGVAAHRDIKPANIMLTHDGTVKIADFGIARTEGSHLTQIGALIGTPAYMAPEQFRGEHVDLRTDIWAAGVVLYQLLTDEKPFDGANPATVMHRVLNTEPQPPSTFTVTAPRTFDTVIARALAKRPEDRYPTARAFAEAIRAAAASRGPDAPLPGPQPSADPTVFVTSKPAGFAPLPGLGPNDESTIGGPGSAARLAMPQPQPQPKPSKRPSAPPPEREGRSGGKMVLALLGLTLLAGAGAAAWHWQDDILALVNRPPGSGSPPPDPQPPTPDPPTPDPQPPTPDPQPPTPDPQPPTPTPDPQPQPPQNLDTPTQPVTPNTVGLRAAGQAATQTPCSLLTWAVTDQTLTVRGVLRRSDVATLGRNLVGRGVPDSASRLEIQPFDGPFCDALELFRPILGAFGAAPAVAVQGQTPLASGERIRITIDAPEWSSYLYVGYLDTQGNIAHLTRARPMRPGERFVLGESETYTVSTPYGTDLVVVISSEQPLFATETLSNRFPDFLPVLSRALANQMQRQHRIAMRPLVVETVERRR